MRDLQRKDVLVIGIGRSGISAIELLIRKGARVRAMDERPASALGGAFKGLKEAGVPLLQQDVDILPDVDLVVLSPGVPVDTPVVASARRKGVPVIGEVELAAYFLQGPIIGITGSNGKTTTTALTGHILRSVGIPVQVGGNIGTAPTAIIDSSSEQQWNVLELSSFQLETIETFRAQIAACMNITPDHLDRHGTLENYVRAKARLFETQTSDCSAVLNADDPTCVSLASRTEAKVYWFSSTQVQPGGAYLKGGQVLLDDKQLLATSEIPLPGRHNVENSMAAALASYLAGAPHAAIREAVASFPGVEHRLEFVRERNGVRYYNDSKATNVDATEKAIDAFQGNLLMILGGKDKNSDYSVLRSKLSEKARGIFLIGAAAPKIAAQLEGLPVQHSGTLEGAVESAARVATRGDIVLLAPACASFDQFENFEHRGRAFKELVRAL